MALVCFSCYSNAEEFIEPGSDGTTKHTIYDDGRVQIDLPFDYTLGGQTFITSWMYSNGVVGFLSAPNGMVPHFCCSGQDVAQMAANGTLPGIPYFNYSIAALWTDLIDLNVDVDGDGVADSGFFTKELDTNNDGQVDTLRYYWRYISEFYSTEALNSFGIEITDANTVEIHHFDIDIRNHAVTVGIFGNTNEGDIEQFEYHSQSYNNSQTTLYTFNLAAACAANPLISPTCDGYADAYAELLYNNACAADPLYDSGCIGYQQAYLAQQCALDALYDASCDGYEEAYYAKYIAPTLEEQANEAAGLDTTTDTSTDFATVVDPVESLTEVSVTGDATVDEVLRDTVDVTDTNIGIDTTFDMDVPEIETDFAEVEVEEQQEQQEEQIEEIEIASIEGELDERETESSSDVDEQVDDSGTEESIDSEQPSEGSSDADSEGNSESEQSSSNDKKESKKEKLKKAVTKRAMQLADRMSNAKTIEMQQAIQAQVLALINYVPDFAKYGGNITGGYYPDVGGYQDSQLPENNRGLRNGLAQQLLHQQMVDMQYERD